MIKKIIIFPVVALLCINFCSSCGNSQKADKSSGSEKAVITSDEFADMVKNDSATIGNNYTVSGTLRLVSSSDKPFVILNGDCLMRFYIAESDQEKLQALEKNFYAKSSEISVEMSGKYASNNTASDGTLNVVFEESIFSDIDGFEEPTYQDVTVGEIVIPAELKATLSDKSSLSYVVDVSGIDSVQIFVSEMSENEIIWSDDDMKNWVVSFKQVDGAQDYTISDELVNGYRLFTYSDSNGISYVACRDYGTNKYSFVFREKWTESDCTSFLSKLVNT